MPVPRRTEPFSSGIGKNALRVTDRQGAPVGLDRDAVRTLNRDESIQNYFGSNYLECFDQVL